MFTDVHFGKNRELAGAPQEVHGKTEQKANYPVWVFTVCLLHEPFEASPVGRQYTVPLLLEKTIRHRQMRAEG